MDAKFEMTGPITVVQQRRWFAPALVDCIAWAVGLVAAVGLRFEFEMAPRGWIATAAIVAIAAVLQIIIGSWWGLYRGRYAYGSFDEVRTLAWSVLTQTFVLSIVVILFGNVFGIPRATVLLAAPFALLVMFGVRYLSRLLRDRSRKPGEEAEPALIIGAGYVGEALLRQATTDPLSSIRPVGILDDDPAKKNLVVRGVPVIGRIRDLADAAGRTGATVAVVATLSAFLMRIVYLHQYFNTPEQSGGTRSYEFARRLVARGHEVHVVTSDRARTPGGAQGWASVTIDGIQVHRRNVGYDNSMGVGRRLQAFVSFAVKSALLARRLHADVLFATSTPLTIILPAWYAAIGRRTPIVFEVRDSWPTVPIALGYLKNPVMQRAARALERFAYRKSAHIVALSPGMKEDACAHGALSENVTVIPNAADVDLFTVDGSAGKRWRRQQNIEADAPVVVYTGTFGAANGREERTGDSFGLGRECERLG